MAELPRKAKVVIVGGGVIGCSIAYHLTKIGWDDVVLLERKQLTSGTTWHAAGLVGQLRPSINMTKLAKYTGELYRGLEAETGQATGYRQCGSISMATNQERFEELKRSASMAKVFDLPVHVVTPDEIKALASIVNIDDVVGGIHIPSDGYANAVDITQALARGARTGGARIFENTKVIKIRHDGDRVTGVDTDDGSIDADFVVICGGMWTRDLAASVGVAAPRSEPNGAVPPVRVIRNRSGWPSCSALAARVSATACRRSVSVGASSPRPYAEAASLLRCRERAKGTPPTTLTVSKTP